MWCYIRIFCVLFLSILYTNAVNMCKNQTAGGNDVTLNLAPGTYVSGCNCSVKPVNIGSVKITFETVQFSGCKYRLIISYKDTNSIISCSNNNTVFYDINTSDEIKLYLEPSTSQDETTTFEVTITSDPSVRLECSPPYSNHSMTTTQSSTNTITTQSAQISTTTTTPLLPTETNTPNSTKAAYTPTPDDTDQVDMCTNQSSSSKDLTLNLAPETGVSGCNCSVRLTRPDNIDSFKPKIIFETVQFSGCKYNLVTSYKDTNSIISCSNNNSVSYDINKSDEIKLYLESTNSQDETTFEVKITSNVTAIGGPLFSLMCSAPKLNPSVTTTQSSTKTTFQPTQTNTPNSTKPAYTPTPDDTDQDIDIIIT